MIDLTAPWYSYHSKLTAMFLGDPQVRVNPLSEDANGNYSVNIIVNNAEKAWALRRILIRNISFSNVTLSINVLSIAKDKVSSLKNSDAVFQFYENALSGNKAFIKIESNSLSAMSFCIFKKSVVQYYNDDLTDYYGNWNGLFRDIANEIFDFNTYPINFCTDIT